MAKISIIIPCYNVENYIDRCLESVVAQTIGLDMMEIIVVNDASTDGTLEKLYQWERDYPQNIMVITYEENLRQGGARNIGMQYATGEYIGFIDADDWVEKDMYELLYEKMSTQKYDMVKCKYVRERFVGECPLSEEGRQDVEYSFNSKNGLFFGKPTDHGNCGMYGGFWTGLYKRTLLEENEIRFPEHLAYEDNYFASIMWLYVGRLYILDKVLYHYFVNPTSTVMTKNSIHHLDRLTIEVMLVEAYKERGAFDVYHDEIEADFLKRFYLNTWHIIFTKFTYVPDILPYMQKVILELFPHYKNNPLIGKEYRAWLELLDRSDKVSPKHLTILKEAYIKPFRF